MKNIERIVKSLVDTHDTNNPFKLAKALKIKIVYEELGSILGYYSKTHRTKVIHINQNLNKKAQEFVCAHELGHAIQHANSNTSFLKKHTLFSTNKLEQQANLFAIYLLFHKNDLECTMIDSALYEYHIPEELLENF